MDTDHSIEIERVANGWIIRPSYRNYPPKITYEEKDNTFIFETFESMIKWMDAHFTKPEKE